MREELLTELHSPSWPRVAKKEPMVVIDRATLDEEGGDPSSRRSPRAAADTKGNKADQGGVRGGAPTWLYC